MEVKTKIKNSGQAIEAIRFMLLFTFLFIFNMFVSFHRIHERQTKKTKSFNLVSWEDGKCSQIGFGKRSILINRDSSLKNHIIRWFFD